MDICVSKDVIFTQLNNWSESTGNGETIITPGIIFSDADNVIPDVVWVKEYWIVDRFRKQVEVYRREKGKLNLVGTLFEDDELTSPLLPNFVVLINRFFPVN